MWLCRRSWSRVETPRGRCSRSRGGAGASPVVGQPPFGHRHKRSLRLPRRFPSSGREIRSAAIGSQSDASEPLSVGIGGNLDVGHPVENDFADIRKVIREFFGLVFFQGHPHNHGNSVVTEQREKRDQGAFISEQLAVRKPGQIVGERAIPRLGGKIRALRCKCMGVLPQPFGIISRNMVVVPADNNLIIGGFCRADGCT